MSGERGLDRVVPRHSPELRCAYCHGPAADAEPCSGCATLVHPDCTKQAGGCVTLGCRAARRPPARPRVRRRRDLSEVVRQVWESNRALVIANVLVWGALTTVIFVLFFVLGLVLRMD